mgnify:CR=1 FL=1
MRVCRDCQRLPLGGKLSAKQTDEGVGLEQLSVHRHLIRPFGPPSPQGEGFGTVQTVEGFPLGVSLSCGADRLQV